MPDCDDCCDSYRSPLLCGFWWVLIIAGVFMLTFGIAGICMYFQAKDRMGRMTQTLCTVSNISITEDTCSQCNNIKVGNTTVCIRSYWTCYQSHWTYSYVSHNTTYYDAHSESGYSGHRTRDSALSWVNSQYPLGSVVDCWADGSDVVYSKPSYALGIGLMSTGFGVAGLLFLGYFMYMIWVGCSYLCGSSSGSSGNYGNRDERGFCAQLCDFSELFSCCDCNKRNNSSNNNRVVPNRGSRESPISSLQSSMSGATATARSRGRPRKTSVRTVPTVPRSKKTSMIRDDVPYAPSYGYHEAPISNYIEAPPSYEEVPITTTNTSSYEEITLGEGEYTKPTIYEPYNQV